MSKLDTKKADYRKCFKIKYLGWDIFSRQIIPDRRRNFFLGVGANFSSSAGLDLHAFGIEERVGKHRKGEFPLFSETVPDSRP